MRNSIDHSLSAGVRHLLRPTYYQWAYFSERVRLRRLWQSSRRMPGNVFFPALRDYVLNTGSHLQRTRLNGNDSHVRPIPDAKTFERVPPKTILSNPLVHLAVPFNPPLLAAKIQNARVFGDAGDVITDDNILLADLSFRYPSRLFQERGEHPLLSSNPLPRARPLCGTFALLTSLYAGGNYFHWMFNSLPRIALLDRAGVPRNSLDGLLMNRLELPAVAETLRALDISRSFIVEMDRNAALELESLWVVPSLITSGHRRRSICDWLRTQFLLSSAQPHRRLYLSRADASVRRMANEDELLHILEPLGFEKIVIGDRSVFEQSALFAQAESVIAPHTAALANLVFCSPGTRVLDIMPQDRLRTYYWELSAAMKLDYYYAYSEPDPRPRPDRIDKDDTIFPIDRLRVFLQAMGIT